MKSIFEQAKNQFPILTYWGNQAECSLDSDFSECIKLLTKIGDMILTLIFTYDRISLPTPDTTIARIDALYREGLLSKDIAEVFHAIDKAHEEIENGQNTSLSNCKVLYQMTCSICGWFLQAYSDHSVYNGSMMTFEQIKNDCSMSEYEIENRLTEETLRIAKEAAALSFADRKAKSDDVSEKHVKPEEATRFLIDEQLRKVGWEANTQVLRYSKGTRPEKGRNIAIAEWPTESTTQKNKYVDYALFVGLKMVATVEAKASFKDVSSVLDYQCDDYSRTICDPEHLYQFGEWNGYRVPFTFATNGRTYVEQYREKSGIWFRDLRDPQGKSEAFRGWMSPEGLLALYEKDTEALNRQLESLPYVFLRDAYGLSLYDYQYKAVLATEAAILAGQKNILIAMATGTGKTRTILAMIYRFLKTGRFKRILYLVDRTSLGTQALDEFMEVKLQDLLTLNEIYDIKSFDSQFDDSETKLRIATVQSMVKRILYNSDGPMPSVSDYDLVIVDEAHRGYILDREMSESELLYRDEKDYQSKYREVIEYFDAVKIALTDTPALHTTEIFGKPVYTYSYREAVLDGYLVDHDAPHELPTKLGTEGIHYKKGEDITVYNPESNQVTSEEVLEDELDFDIDSFNRRIVNDNHTRVVLEEIARCIDPESPETQGKTLIFAVNDDHADRIVNILRDIYSQTGVPEEAILKITGKAGNGNRDQIENAIRRFKNERYPSIVVTVDLLTTGINVRSITSLVFMRRVKSRILFEQMLGRATRKCDEINKTHFEIFDPVDVYKSLEPVSSMKPVVVNPQTSFGQLLDGIAVLEDERQLKEQVEQIIAKLQRRKKHLSNNTMEHFVSLTGGSNPSQVIDFLHSASAGEARQRLQEYAEALKLLDAQHYSNGHSIVISDAEDVLLEHTRGYGNGSRPEDYLDQFEIFVRTHINEIAALNIICTRPRDLTRQSLKDLRLALAREGFSDLQLNSALNQMTNQDMVVDIITLIRRYALGSALIPHEVRIHHAVEKLKHAHSFSMQEKNWLGRMESYLMNESVLNVNVFDEDSRFAAQGGFSRINRIFGNKLTEIVQELNDYLYDDGGTGI